MIDLQICSDCKHNLNLKFEDSNRHPYEKNICLLINQEIITQEVITFANSKKYTLIFCNNYIQKSRSKK